MATEGGEHGEDLKYSRGVRRQIYKLFHKEKDFILHAGKTGHYSEELCSAVFSLPPLGSGQSPRTFDSSMHGAIPVIIQVWAFNGSVCLTVSLDRFVRKNLREHENSLQSRGTRQWNALSKQPDD